jgi:hypothetical protein
MPLFLGIAALSLACIAAAQQPIVYPAKGQSAQQQSQDDAQCYAWAKQATGIDPAVVAASPPPQQTGPAVGGGQRAAGAARGAAGGAAVGAITGGGAGKGAGAGAVVGTMVGGRDARKQQAAQNQHAHTQQQHVMQTYYRAYGACMEGRGYTIK